MPIHFRLEYDHQNGMVIHLTLTALDRVYNHLLHTENFYLYTFEYFQPKEKNKSIRREKPNITEIFYTDKKNNRIKEVNFEPDMIICLNIRGENLKGEEVDFDLQNVKVDFEYKGEYLKNDTLSGYVFQSDNDKIELKVIKPKNE
ncbi:hypothetical protein [Capnocytophaga canimorsus]|uniref:hypothetical protein n=1 Tax=Capnocytophaga canimorsus TaxID=28188 RepID=UPI001BB3B45E|nr:hypothetical protein [Capnocytophaga canimorsus]